MQMRRFAKGRRRHTPGRMNKTEQRYAEHLFLLQRDGAIKWYKFEGIKLKLAPKTFYMPDFAVIRNDGALEFHEVKGHWEDDAKVKIKVAAELFPCFRFFAIKPGRNGWHEYEEF
jgi:hypothetical protein